MNTGLYNPNNINPLDFFAHALMENSDITLTWRGKEGEIVGVIRYHHHSDVASLRLSLQRFTEIHNALRAARMPVCDLFPRAISNNTFVEIILSYTQLIIVSNRPVLTTPLTDADERTTNEYHEWVGEFFDMVNEHRPIPGRPRKTTKSHVEDRDAALEIPYTHEINC